ncbi:hypothetical protein EYC84_011226 [Monilinia fructicola]|uniref:Rhodopsin domain-containing protein n=1 Tax=Monilinia fructicola TaxID=38448 RepID=A0A5M9J8W0_MONFR|nr:hypothetical protein EYC84_011226 [Monilinia fructicola]
MPLTHGPFSFISGHRIASDLIAFGIHTNYIPQTRIAPDIGFSSFFPSLLIEPTRAVRYHMFSFSVIQSSVVLGACSKGFGEIDRTCLGKESGADPTDVLHKFGIVHRISRPVKIFRSCVLLGSLTPDQKHKKIFRAAIGLMVAWTISSTFAVALQCNLTYPWRTIGERCDNALLRWQMIASFDIVFELAFVLLAVYLVWSLRTSKSNKTIVVVAFSFRLPMIIAIAYRLATF